VTSLQVPLLAAPMAGITAAPLRLMYSQVRVQKGWGDVCEAPTFTVTCPPVAAHRPCRYGLGVLLLLLLMDLSPHPRLVRACL
jgi:hypothetical protein